MAFIQPLSWWCNQGPMCNQGPRTQSTSCQLATVYPDQPSLEATNVDPAHWALPSQVSKLQSHCRPWPAWSLRPILKPSLEVQSWSPVLKPSLEAQFKSPVLKLPKWARVASPTLAVELGRGRNARHAGHLDWSVPNSAKTGRYWYSAVLGRY